MNIKTIVKVMNFHSLIRVDRAHKEADKYAMLEREVTHMIDIIQNNRNFILDKKILSVPEDAPRLKIYIGSDLGFCGAVNASVNMALSKETGENELILIGKKIHSPVPPILSLTREEFDTRYDELRNILAEAVRKNKYSAVDLCYDHYYNMSHIEPVDKTVYPLCIGKNIGKEEDYRDDFAIEGGDVDEILEELIITYLNYELKIAAVNTFASENILRQAATNESLKRIDEMEQENLWEQRKIKTQESARKAIDSFIKTRRK